ncbi:MAG: hypothetical protein WBA93_24630 [Microcoleaceae cyanobacterium]
MDKSLTGFKLCHSNRDENGHFRTPYSEKRGKSRGVRLPPALDEWMTEQVEKRGCSRNDLFVEAVELFFAKETGDKDSAA